MLTGITFRRPEWLVSEAAHEQFKSYLLAASSSSSSSQANTSSSTGWDSPDSKPSTKASSLASTADKKGKGKQVDKTPEKKKEYGAEQFLQLPAGVRLADAFESPEKKVAPAPKENPQASRPIAPAISKKIAVSSSQSVSAPKVPVAPVKSLDQAPVLAQTIPTLAAEPEAPLQKKRTLQISKPGASKEVDSVVHLPVEMEDVVFHKNQRVEYRDFDGDVVMQDLPEIPMQVPKKLDSVLGQRKFKRQRQKSRVSPRVIQMAEEEIKRMRRSS